MTPNLLVIGYGNTLRRDDGVGPGVAEAVAALGLPGVQTLACALLTPELAEPVARAGMVVFVDAAVDAPREVQLRRLEPADSARFSPCRRSPDAARPGARRFRPRPAGLVVDYPHRRPGHRRGTLRHGRSGSEVAVREIQRLASA